MKNHLCINPCSQSHIKGGVFSATREGGGVVSTVMLIILGLLFSDQILQSRTVADVESLGPVEVELLHAREGEEPVLKGK